MSPDMPDDEVYALAERLGEALSARRFMLASAESCTGGWASMAVTAVPGSSAWFERGFITYSNAAKQDMLGVKSETLAAHGAVSEEVAMEMAKGAADKSGADACLAISGVAGPGGGSAAKPVGLVCLAWLVRGVGLRSRCQHCQGDRQAVRRAAVVLALQGLIELLASSDQGS